MCFIFIRLCVACVSITVYSISRVCYTGFKTRISAICVLSSILFHFQCCSTKGQLNFERKPFFFNYQYLNYNNRARVWLNVAVRGRAEHTLTFYFKLGVRLFIA